MEAGSVSWPTNLGVAGGGCSQEMAHLSRSETVINATTAGKSMLSWTGYYTVWLPAKGGTVPEHSY